METRGAFDPRMWWPRVHHGANAPRSPGFPPGGGRSRWLSIRWGRLSSPRTRPTSPSTPIGTKPVGLVYPSPRLPLRSCGYLGFSTHPPLNPVGVVYAVTCGFTSALKAPPDPHWAPQIHPESITVRAHLYIIRFAPQPPKTGPLHTPIRSLNRSLTTTTARCPRRPARPLISPSQCTVTDLTTMAWVTL